MDTSAVEIPEMIGTQNATVVKALEKEVAFLHDCNTRQKEIIGELEEAIRKALGYNQPPVPLAVREILYRGLQGLR